jgi:hypothetical protein
MCVCVCRFHISLAFLFSFIYSSFLYLICIIPSLLPPLYTHTLALRLTIAFVTHKTTVEVTDSIERTVTMETGSVCTDEQCYHQPSEGFHMQTREVSVDASVRIQRIMEIH